VSGIFRLPAPFHRWRRRWFVPSAAGAALPKSNTAEGGTDNVAVTTGNSGGASGDAWNAVTNPSGTLIFDTERVVDTGAMAYKMQMPDGNPVLLHWDFAPVAELYFRMYVNIGDVPTTGAGLEFLRIKQAGGAHVFLIELGTTTDNGAGKFTLYDQGGLNQFSTVNAYNDDAWYRLELHLIKGDATAGTIEFHIYDLHETTPLESFVDTSADVGSVDMGSLDFGGTGQGGGIWELWLDDIGVTNVDWLGPTGSPAAGGQKFMPVVVAA